MGVLGGTLTAFDDQPWHVVMLTGLIAFASMSAAWAFIEWAWDRRNQRQPKPQNFWRAWRIEGQPIVPLLDAVKEAHDRTQGLAGGLLAWRYARSKPASGVSEGRFHACQIVADASPDYSRALGAPGAAAMATTARKPARRLLHRPS